jgi:hypothetical protein
VIDFLIHAEYRDLTGEQMPLCEFIITADTEQEALDKAQATIPMLKRQGWARIESVEFSTTNLTEWMDHRKVMYRLLSGTEKTRKITIDSPQPSGQSAP